MNETYDGDPAPTPPDNLSLGLQHLQAAGREVLAAGKALLDAVDDAMGDRSPVGTVGDAVGSVVRGATSAASTAASTAAGAAGVARPGSAPSEGTDGAGHEPGDGSVQRIDVS
jgi:hypothetical protein